MQGQQSLPSEKQKELINLLKFTRGEIEKTCDQMIKMTEEFFDQEIDLKNDSRPERQEQLHSLLMTVGILGTSNRKNFQKLEETLNNK